MKVEVSIKGGKSLARYYVKLAALETQGLKMINRELSDKMFFDMLLAGDSPCKEYEFWIRIRDISEKVHTHIVRHERIGKYVTHQAVQGEGLRRMTLKIDALRMIEIARSRMCQKAYIDTQLLVNNIVTEICEIEPVFNNLFNPYCVWYGGCPMGKKHCLYTKSEDYENKRDAFEGLLLK